MVKPIVRLAMILGAAQIGTYLGDTPRHGAGTPSGVNVGPLNVTVTNVAPAVLAGIFCGGSPLFSLLTSYALSTLIGDRYETQVLERVG